MFRKGFYSTYPQMMLGAYRNNYPHSFLQFGATAINQLFIEIQGKMNGVIMHKASLEGMGEVSITLCGDKEKALRKQGFKYEF